MSPYIDARQRSFDSYYYLPAPIHNPFVFNGVRIAWKESRKLALRVIEYFFKLNYLCYICLSRVKNDHLAISFMPALWHS
jgi:hypothetical protein